MQQPSTFSSKLIWNSFETPCALGKLNHVTIWCVPAYEGIEGNEKVDANFRKRKQSFILCDQNHHMWYKKKHIKRVMRCWIDTPGEKYPKVIAIKPYKNKKNPRSEQGGPLYLYRTLFAEYHIHQIGRRKTTFAGYAWLRSKQHNIWSTSAHPITCNG